ncbi:MAG: TRAP transporter large permease [Clostridiales Family XIII bacterium]|jgi:C4-dicarboxylate transporter DctM subunit|nr:TRAP transporter large permease [Clostridiales Family XIII bacterium]
MEIIFVSVVFLLALLFVGAPIAVAVASAAILIWLIDPSVVTDPGYVFQSIVNTLDSYVLLAVPMFILSGIIMARGGIAKKLFDFFTFFIGGKTAGLPCAVVVTCMFYGALSGSGPATCAAVGSMSIPVLVNLGYEKGFATALVCVAGGLGVIIPPSIPMIIHGQATGTSIGDLFIAGIIPGIVVGVCLMAYAFIYCKRKGEDRAKVDAAFNEIRAKGFRGILKDSFWALMTPVIILGGIYGGIVTPTEAACVSVVYSLIISLFVYRTLPFRQVPAAFLDAVHSFGPMMWIIGACSAYGRAMTLLGASSAMTEWLTSSFASKIAILLVINLILLVMGCFLDTIAAVLLMAPLLLPVVLALGMSPVQFGVIMVVNLAAGFVTPPVGGNLFIAQSLTKLPITVITRHAFPLLAFFILALMLITYVPSLSLALNGG